MKTCGFHESAVRCRVSHSCTMLANPAPRPQPHRRLRPEALGSLAIAWMHVSSSLTSRRSTPVGATTTRRARARDEQSGGVAERAHQVQSACEEHARRLDRRSSERNRRQGGPTAQGPMTPRMWDVFDHLRSPSPGCAGWSVAIMVSAPRTSMSSSPTLPMAWQRVGGASWEHDQPPRHGPSRHRTAAPLPLCGHCPGHGTPPPAAYPLHRCAPGCHPRQAATSRAAGGCSTCRTWPSSQTSCATRCTPPSLPSPCTPKRAAGVRARAGG